MAMFLKSLTVTVDAMENCLEGSGSRNGKDSKEMVAIVHLRRSGGLDVGGYIYRGK